MFSRFQIRDVFTLFLTHCSKIHLLSAIFKNYHNHFVFISKERLKFYYRKGNKNDLKHLTAKNMRDENIKSLFEGDSEEVPFDFKRTIYLNKMNYI